MIEHLDYADRRIMLVGSIGGQDLCSSGSLLIRIVVNDGEMLKFKSKPQIYESKPPKKEINGCNRDLQNGRFN